ncbi:hypothetical protein [Tautonia rosea]|uniref:hypothetical protein n=1 Tax=Tautonia rosea TaxID=2728037 RepID=UPI00147383DF|nr:hypothetical protein [Tautonia rosea]
MIRPKYSEDENRYEAPRSDADRAASRSDRPPWSYLAYSVYCFCVALLYGSLGLVVAADWRFGIFRDPADRPDRQFLPVVAAIALGVATLFAVGPFLPKRPWAWTYGLILILVGNILTVPLALCWISRGARGYYARIPECVRVISEFPHASRSSARLPGLRRG